MKKITAEEFFQIFGYKPENDDLDRVNCEKAGKVGHYCCGWCPKARILSMLRILWVISFLSACSAYDFETKDELFVSEGKFNHPEKELIEYWTQEVFSLWKKQGWDSCIENSVKGLNVQFIDDNVFIFGGVQVVGVWDGYYNIIVGAGNPRDENKKESIHSLFKHELSHPIVCECGNFCDAENSHGLYSKVGAGF